MMYCMRFNCLSHDPQHEKELISQSTFHNITLCSVYMNFISRWKNITLVIFQSLTAYRRQLKHNNI